MNDASHAFARSAVAFALAVLVLAGSSLLGARAEVLSDAAGAHEEGRAALRRRDAGEAEDAFQRAIAADPSLADAHYRLGLLLGGRSQWKPAIASLQTATKLDPDHVDAHCELGEAYLIGAVQSPEAVPPLLRALELEPHHPRARRLLGAALLRQHRLDEAVGNLRQAVALDPGDVDSHYLLGLAYYQDEEYALASATLADVVERWPWHAQAHATLGNALIRTGDVAAGRWHLREFEQLYRASERTEVLERETAVSPTDAGAWFRLAQQYVTRQAWDQAGAALRTYVRLRPADEGGRALLGYVYLESDAYEPALDVYGWFATQYPDLAEHHGNLGIVYLLLGEDRAAIDQLRRAVELDPRERRYLLNLERAYRRAGEPERADETAQRYRELAPTSGPRP
ncbi:tetratricopeptide repeat protein [Candidatus Poribacteria bacterium]|nr:tetratricopeptide repeat protein [Candidatus Poribacteria bacterium]